ncbi:hypothetical protein GE061_009609 [Apolygus lucorum]|uniref:Uncharacterized protein n=1 Tax=Apolygus lucorum TaxID=248454 RepID=A0A6A4KDN3_APOLU|nr:hypothetical protein GE061_009609 [Apolygus lucorum]
MQGRAETKKGDQVVGSYQYSDGHVKVKVVYSADQHGYKILKEERATMKPPSGSEVPTFKAPKESLFSPKPLKRPPVANPSFEESGADGNQNHPPFPSDAPHGLQLSTFDLKLRTNHGSGGYSHQGLSINPGKSTKYQSDDSENDKPSKTSKPTWQDHEEETSHGLGGYSHQGLAINSGKSTKHKVNQESLHSSKPPKTKNPSWQDHEEGTNIFGGTNHGSGGYSHQGLSFNPGKSTKHKVNHESMQNFKPPKTKNPIWQDEDAFNHSLERQNEVRPKPIKIVHKTHKMHFRNAPGNKPKNRKPKISTEGLAIFFKDQNPINAAALFTPQEATNPVAAPKKRNPRRLRPLHL